MNHIPSLNCFEIILKCPSENMYVQQSLHHLTLLKSHLLTHSLHIAKVTSPVRWYTKYLFFIEFDSINHLSMKKRVWEHSWKTMLLNENSSQKNQWRVGREGFPLTGLMTFLTWFYSDYCSSNYPFPALSLIA